MVEYVEDLSPELEPHPLGELKQFRHPHIDLPHARPTGHVPRCVSPCTVRRRDEGGRVDPLGGPFAAWRRERNCRYKIRTLIVGVAVGRLGSRTIDHDVDRESCVGYGRGGELPVTDDGVYDSGLVQEGLAKPEWKLVNSVGIDDIASIPDAAGAFTLRASDILRHQRVTITAAIGAVVNFVRPHVIGREQEAARERAL